jgi:uncharacterized membrane protein YhaH (DUF805 family)
MPGKLLEKTIGRDAFLRWGLVCLFAGSVVPWVLFWVFRTDAEAESARGRPFNGLASMIGREVDKAISQGQFGWGIVAGVLFLAVIATYVALLLLCARRLRTLGFDPRWAFLGVLMTPFIFWLALLIPLDRPECAAQRVLDLGPDDSRPAVPRSVLREGRDN